MLLTSLTSLDSDAYAPGTRPARCVCVCLFVAMSIAEPPRNETKAASLALSFFPYVVI